MRLFLTYIFCTLGLLNLRAQNAYADSLRRVIRTTSDSKVKADNYVKLTAYFATRSFIDSAIRYADVGIRLTDSLHDEENLSSLYYNKGVAYLFQGMNTQALNYMLKCVPINERRKDTTSLANNYNVIGIIYLYMKSFDKAVEYGRKSMTLYRQLHDEASLTDSYGNLGNAKFELHQDDSALYFFSKSLEIAAKYHFESKESINYMNIGDVYLRQKKYPEALDMTLKSLSISDHMKEPQANSKLYLNLGLIYNGLKNYGEAHRYYDKAIGIENIIKNPDNFRQIYEGLSALYASEKNFVKAYEYHKLYAQYNDSVYNKENLQSISDIKTNYEVEKKEQEFKQLSGEQKLKSDAELKKQKLIRNAFSVGFILLFVLAFFIYRSYRIKKRSNEVITSQKDEIERKSADLQVAYTEIKHSIDYARQIQKAILPPPEAIRQRIPQCFIFYRPKDVVSGDFYFFNPLSFSPTPAVILAVCDCTGHGVPGAFMSLVGNELLNKIISDQHIIQPSLILDHLHQGIKTALKQEETNNRDGMDAAVCKIDLANGELEYAGANRPLWIIRYGTRPELIDVKADKQAIGGLESGHRGNFTNHRIPLQANDRVFLFSDGYADQFGGPRGKKFMIKQLQALLLETAHLSISRQGEALEKAYNSWQEGYEQVDDVCIIGFTV